jgi:hypothetical protein
MILSQEIASGESDKFQLLFGDRIEKSDLIGLNIKIIYDRDDKILHLPKILFVTDETRHEYSLMSYLLHKQETLNRAGSETNGIKDLNINLDSLAQITIKNSSTIDSFADYIKNPKYSSIESLISGNNEIYFELKESDANK